MNNRIYLFISFVALSFAATSQCTKTYSSTGVYPTQLKDAYELIPYTFEVDFTFPVDTVISGQNIHIDSLEMTNCTGFPGSNFSYSCGAANCKYVAGSLTKFQGCIMLNGTAPAGSAGTYKLVLDLKAYFSFFGNPQNYTVTDSTAKLTVKACNLNASAPVPVDAMICPGKFTILSADSGNYTYIWLKDGLATTDSTHSITVSDSSKYMVILKDENGCVDTSGVGMVGIYAMPSKPTVNKVALKAVCSLPGMHYSWSLNGNDLAIDKDTIPCQDGYLKVKYKNANGCWSDFSDSIFFVCSGILSLDNNFMFELFPNPAKAQINLQFHSEKEEMWSISLADVTGRIVYNERVNLTAGEHAKALSLQGLTKGVYLLQLQSHSYQGSQRLVIE